MLLPTPFTIKALPALSVAVTVPELTEVMAADTDAVRRHCREIEAGGSIHDLIDARRCRGANAGRGNIIGHAIVDFRTARC